jgi:hypothetical protein
MRRKYGKTLFLYGACLTTSQAMLVPTIGENDILEATGVQWILIIEKEV